MVSAGPLVEDGLVKKDEVLRSETRHILAPGAAQILRATDRDQFHLFSCPFSPLEHPRYRRAVHEFAALDGQPEDELVALPSALFEQEVVDSVFVGEEEFAAAAEGALGGAAG